LTAKAQTLALPALNTQMMKQLGDTSDVLTAVQNLKQKKDMRSD
jgi:hypothetical protein